MIWRLVSEFCIAAATMLVFYCLAHVALVVCFVLFLLCALLHVPLKNPFMSWFTHLTVSGLAFKHMCLWGTFWLFLLQESGYQLLCSLQNSRVSGGFDNQDKTLPVTRYSVSFPDTPPGFALFLKDSAHARLVAEGSLPLLTGDRDFDDLFWLECKDEVRERVLQYFSPERRELLLQVWLGIPEALWMEGVLQGEVSRFPARGLAQRLEMRVAVLKRLGEELANPRELSEPPAPRSIYERYMSYFIFRTRLHGIVCAVVALLLFLGLAVPERYPPTWDEAVSHLPGVFIAFFQLLAAGQMLLFSRSLRLRAFEDVERLKSARKMLVVTLCLTLVELPLQGRLMVFLMAPVLGVLIYRANYFLSYLRLVQPR